MSYKKVGPSFGSPERFVELVNGYFKECEGQPVFDRNGTPLLNKLGNIVIMNRRTPSVTGLALALGFPSREAFLAYIPPKKYAGLFPWAMSRLEEAIEERLFDRDACNGAKFSLEHNFPGWKEGFSTRSGKDVVLVDLVRHKKIETAGIIESKEKESETPDADEADAR